MKTLEKLTFDWMCSYDRDVDLCVANGMALIVAGEDGVGKVHLLERQAKRYPNPQNPGRAHLHQLSWESEPIKSIRNIIDDIDADTRETQGDVPWRGKSLGQTVDILVDRIIDADIRLLLFTRADSAKPDFYSVFEQVHTRLDAKDHYVGVVFAGRTPASKLTKRIGDASANTLSTRIVRPLAAGDCLLALDNWCDGVSGLIGKVREEKKKSKPAEGYALASLILQRSGGNLATLAKMAVMKNDRYPGEELTRDLVEKVIDHLNGDFALESEVEDEE